MIFFSEFQWHDLGFLGKVLIFLGFLGKINCQDLGKKSKNPKILATNEKNSKILAGKPSRQALGGSKSKEIERTTESNQRKQSKKAQLFRLSILERHLHDACGERLK